MFCEKHKQSTYVDEDPSESTSQGGIAMSWQTKVTGINGSSRNFLSSFINEDQWLRIALPFCPPNKKSMAKCEV